MKFQINTESSLKRGTWNFTPRTRGTWNSTSRQRDTWNFTPRSHTWNFNPRLRDTWNLKFYSQIKGYLKFYSEIKGCLKFYCEIEGYMEFHVTSNWSFSINSEGYIKCQRSRNAVLEDRASLSLHISHVHFKLIISEDTMFGVTRFVRDIQHLPK